MLYMILQLLDEIWTRHTLVFFLQYNGSLDYHTADWVWHTGDGALYYGRVSHQGILAGDVVVDMEARMVMKAGVPVVLTNKEYGLLVLFIQNKNIALFKESLYEKVWGEEYDGDSRTLELHVQRLRKKMGWENQLVAVYKVGYRLEIA